MEILFRVYNFFFHFINENFFRINYGNFHSIKRNIHVIDNYSHSTLKSTRKIFIFFFISIQLMRIFNFKCKNFLFNLWKISIKFIWFFICSISHRKHEYSVWIMWIFIHKNQNLSWINFYHPQSTFSLWFLKNFSFSKKIFFLFFLSIKATNFYPKKMKNKRKKN